MGDKRRQSALADLSVDDAYELAERLRLPIWELVRSLLGKPLEGFRDGAKESNRIYAECCAD